MAIKKICDGEVKEYWLVFTQGTNFLSKILKKNYSHVYVITRDKYNWIVLNPLRLQLDISLPSVYITDDLPRMLKKPFDSIIKVTLYKRERKQVFAYFGLLSCVTMVRYILGLRIYVYTPFQLYKRLLRLPQHYLDRNGIRSIKYLA